MFFAPSPIGKKTLDEEKLKTDKQSCRKFGPCGVGKEALYLGGRFIDRRYYIPWKEVKRVFKRVAMSAGGFSGKGLFGSMAFLVVQFFSSCSSAARRRNAPSNSRPTSTVCSPAWSRSTPISRRTASRPSTSR